MITIINYKMGNLGSIANMLKKIGEACIVTDDPTVIAKASKIILPGVGAFDKAMTNLNEMNFLEVLNKKVIEEKIPVLGICLGMQLLTNSSEEGSLAGLGWLDAQTVRFKFEDQRTRNKVPHMGWNLVEQKKQSALFDDMYDEPRFYFVHSYHVVCNDKNDILSTTNYEYPFVSSMSHNNIYGVQFHPEKSHKFGMKLLKNFIEKI